MFSPQRPLISCVTLMDAEPAFTIRTQTITIVRAHADTARASRDAADCGNGGHNDVPSVARHHDLREPRTPTRPQHRAMTQTAGTHVGITLPASRDTTICRNARRKKGARRRALPQIAGTRDAGRRKRREADVSRRASHLSSREGRARRCTRARTRPRTR